MSEPLENGLYLNNNSDVREGLYPLVQHMARKDDYWVLGLGKRRIARCPLSISLAKVEPLSRSHLQPMQVTWKGHVGRSYILEEEAVINLHEVGWLVRNLYESHGYPYLEMRCLPYTKNSEVNSWDDVDPCLIISFERSGIHVHFADYSDLVEKLDGIKKISDRTGKKFWLSF